MKTKFLLPVLAMIFAVGMSFTTVNANESAVSGYILISPGNWEPVQVDCNGTSKCLVEFSDEPGVEYEVFATMSTLHPIEGSGRAITLPPLDK